MCRSGPRQPIIFARLSVKKVALRKNCSISAFRRAGRSAAGSFSSSPMRSCQIGIRMRRGFSRHRNKPGALRDALLDAGANPAKADKAAEEAVGYENRLAAIGSRLNLLTWMVGFILAVAAAAVAVSLWMVHILRPFVLQVYSGQAGAARENGKPRRSAQGAVRGNRRRAFDRCQAGQGRNGTWPAGSKASASAPLADPIQK